MAHLFKSDELKEGEFFCKWLEKRLLINNKNVLGAEIGSTGSGKSYRDLRKVEIWYRDYLKKPFPPENICFGVSQVMQRLSSGELTKGEVLIFEEAGANLGSLDFQGRISKMFTYVLQSFRSMNVAIFFNLPYLSMLNKQARMLLHYSSESVGIDFDKGMNKCKLFFHQVNQSTGKIYKKYPRGLVNGCVRTIKRVSYAMPSAELVSIYERKKAKYLMDMTKDYVEELKSLEYEKDAKLGRRDLTVKQKEVLDLLKTGMKQTEIAKKLRKATSTIGGLVESIKKRGYSIENINKLL